MKDLRRLKDMLYDDLEEIAGKGALSSGDLDAVQKLTDTIKNIDKIDMLEDDYSSRMMPDYDRRYSERRAHYVRGHYSRSGGKLCERLDDLMHGDDLTEHEKEVLRDARAALM